MSESLTIVFAGTPEFAVPTLNTLVDSGQPPTLVLTQPDRPAGRGRKERPSPVKECALKHRLRIEQPPGLKTAGPLDLLQQVKPDLIVVVAYGVILPQTVLELPRLGCVNVHASLLPRWRGAAPIQRAILAGDKETGVTIMQMDAGLDTGDMLLKRTTAINDDDTSQTLHDRLAQLGAAALMEALPGLIEGRLFSEPQPAEYVSYAHKLDKSEARLNWSESAANLARCVRAFNPWPVAESTFDGLRMRIWQAEEIDAEAQADPGTVISATSAGIDIATGHGVLRLNTIQLPGKKPITAKDFVNAHELDGNRLY